MSTIHVCPQSRLAETLAASGARSVVTLLAPDALAAALPAMVERHLRLDISDIASPRPGHRLAGRDHLVALLDFLSAWDRRAPLLIHCYSGVSRSTAAAFVALCHLRRDLDERSAATRLRAASPTATPNPRLVAVADALLGRDGRMIEAVAAIGRGADCFEGNVFSLPIEASRAEAPAAGRSAGAV